VQQWNFTSILKRIGEMKDDYFVYLALSFQTVVNRQIFAGNLVNAQTLRKEKYPREFFPEVKKSSRKIFRTEILFRQNGLEKALHKLDG
jgi:hypothetical protein